MRSIAYRFANRLLVLSIILLVLVTAATLFAEQSEGDIETRIDDHMPLFDYDYDDSWVEKVPDIVAGYEVRYINTPKSMACMNTPMLHLRSKQPTLEEFHANPVNVDALTSALSSIPGVPSTSILLSFSPKPVDKLASAASETDWNLKRIEHGCHERWGKIGSNP